MNELKIGDSVHIQSYKHNGNLHRTWSKGIVIDVLDDAYVVVTDQTWVVESDGRRWLAKEPCVCFLYKHNWFNILSMARVSGIHYYCNLASPSLYDGEAIKNIDYDLDVKVFPDGTYNVIDKNEYEYHASLMNYPESIKKIINDDLNKLIDMITKKEGPFDSSVINGYLVKYFDILATS